jgi:hypothetical protein
MGRTGLWGKSDLRNHQAIVQPRLYDSLMVTQITLKTEGPHGLPSGRQTEADPLYRGLIILTDYDADTLSEHLRELSRARTQRLDRGADGAPLGCRGSRRHSWAEARLGWKGVWGRKE